MEEPIMIKDGDIFRHCDIQKLNCSDALKREIQTWDDEYQDTFNSEYPPDSCFDTLDAEKAHTERGAIIAERLQGELGDAYLVEYRT